jgi:transcriptional regulator with XRE-family HTH domain
MGKRRPFFTPQMGARLRELRVRKGLSQAELARRMGLPYRTGKSFVCRLEKGSFIDPHLSTITRYLNACGALFSEFYDTLTRIEPLPVESGGKQMMAKVPKLGGNYSAASQTRVKQKIVTQTGEPPMKPERQRKAAEGFRQYRMQLNIIEQAVKDMLQADEDKAYAEHRKPAVRLHEHFWYLNLARKILGVLRRESEHAISKTKCQMSKGRGKRKTLEERLDEAMRFAAEQQLNLAAAEKVRELVVRTYGRLGASKE